MPKGSPNRQTIASEKYQQKAGFISKSYKLRKEVVEAFQDACNRADISQSAKLTELMLNFINQNEKGA